MKSMTLICLLSAIAMLAGCATSPCKTQQYTWCYYGYYSGNWDGTYGGHYGPDEDWNLSWDGPYAAPCDEP